MIHESPAARPDLGAIAGVLGPRILDVPSGTPPVLVPAGARPGLHLRPLATGLHGSSRPAVVDSGADADMGGTGRPHAVYFKDGKLGGGPGVKGTRLLAAIGVAAAGDGEDFHGHGTCCACVSAGWKWNRKANSDNGHAPEAGIVSYNL